MSLPLIARGRTLGALTLALGPSGRIYRSLDAVLAWARETQLPDGSSVSDLDWVRAHIRAVNAVGGTLVIVMGLLLLSGQLTRLNQLFTFLPLI